MTKSPNDSCAAAGPPVNRRARGSFGASVKAPATLGEWLPFAEQLYLNQKVALGQVATNAHDEALYLMLHALELPLDSDASVLAKKLTVAERTAVADILRRRVVGRVPAAYLTQEAWLGEHRFYVDGRVIIPRSYFLEIIPGLLNTWLPHNGAEVSRVADVCTGSGCLAILLAHRFPSAEVDALDLSAEALEVAKINVGMHRVAQRVHLWESDVFDAVPAARYEVIVSNPPYEPSALVDEQAPEFAAEPRMAHDGGPDGLVIIRKLLQQARTRLAPEGILLIEVGGLSREIDREFAALKPHWLQTEDGSNCVCLFQAARLRGH